MSSATTTSTSFITGTGEKKCSPITRSGCCVQDGELGDRDRRGVGRDDRRLRQQAVQHLEDGALDLGILDDSLDDEVGVDEPRRIVNPGDVADEVGRRGGVQLATADRAIQRCPQPVTRAVQRGGVGLEQDDVEAGAGNRFRDPGAHEPGADDPDSAKCRELAHRANLATYAGVR